MSDPRADVALLVDFTDVRHRLCPEGSAPDDVAPESSESAQPSAQEIAHHLVDFAGKIGRLALARAYADWSRCAGLVGEIHQERLEPVLVPGTADGEDRSHVRLVVDALESLFTGDEPDAFVLVTGDPTLLPLVQRLRADGSEVIVVAPGQAVTEELKAAADRFYPLEEVMDGAEPEAAHPRTWRNARLSSIPGDGDVRGRGTPRVRERPPHPTPVQGEADFEEYDWSPFVQLIDELEHRLPFVGVRYLVNKVLGPHNCGVEDSRLKRDLINRAVEMEMIEMYPVGNVGDRADPVTACRLRRSSTSVITVIGESSVPDGPPEHSQDPDLDPDQDPDAVDLDGEDLASL